MTYREAYEYIEQVNLLGSVPGLNNIVELLNRMDNPQNKIKVIHIAGTNGKGSIGAFLENIFECGGYSVGRYISPSIYTYLERFQINKAYMTEEEFAYILEQVIEAAEKMVAEGYNRPTSFETETAVAFMYFLWKQVDIVLLETGMGGRYDATNVVEQPICTVLASISMDHMQFLGNRIEDILVEKMGIMRENVPCVAYDMEENLKILWLDNCNRLNCPWVMTDNSQAEILSQTEDSSIYSYKGNTYELHTTGTYQIYNSLVAIEVINMVNTYAGDSFKLNETHITSGLAMTNWTGRFQKIKEAPLTYVDGAHNEGGWLSLKENIETYFAGRDITFICGVLADKEYDKMVDILSPFSDNVITVTPDNPRALSGEALAKAFEPYVKNIYVAEDIFDAERISEDIYQNSIMKNGSKNMKDKMQRDIINYPVVVVCGSLSFIGPLIEKYSKNTM